VLPGFSLIVQVWLVLSGVTESASTFTVYRCSGRRHQRREHRCATWMPGLLSRSAGDVLERIRRTAMTSLLAPRHSRRHVA